MERIHKQGGEAAERRRVAQARFTSRSSENALAKDIDESPAMATQRKRLDRLFGPAIQRVEDEEPLQGKFKPVQRVEEGEPLQGNFGTAQRAEEKEPLQGKFEAVQRAEDEEPLQGKFAVAQAKHELGEEEFLPGRFGPAQRVEDEEPLQGKFEAVQRVEDEEPLQGKFETAQRVEDEEPLQGKFETAQRAEEEEPLQGKFEAASSVQGKEEVSKPNNTGLPDNLKSGIESLSGISMDDVKVHYNSSQPAQLNAHAYAQGTDIHVAPGQEQHLPHEAWHIVQQAQGRVQPTMQMKEGVPVNDDRSLEHEADVMGARAIQQQTSPSSYSYRKAEGNPVKVAMQLFRERKDDESLELYARALQGEASRLLELDADTGDGVGGEQRANRRYLLECRDGVNEAIQAEHYLGGVVAELKKAIESEEYTREEEITNGYTIEGLDGWESLPPDDVAKIEERIDAMNEGMARFNLHIGVGNVPTMDVTGVSFGGGTGRGNVRLQFLSDGAMAIVDHKGNSWI